MIGNDLCCHAVQALVALTAPHFCAQQARRHLHQRMVEMHPDHIITPARQIVIENNGSLFACMWMGWADN
jgi:hypothetical protein